MEQQEQPVASANKEIAVPGNNLQRLAAYPRNTSNSFDIAGQLHMQFTDEYLASPNNITTIANTLDQVDNIANAESDYLALLPANYAPPSSARLSYILANVPGRINEVIGQSNLSAKGKISITNFIASITYYRDQETAYNLMYEFIVDYESSIIADTTFTITDRRILLTTSSITRYAFFNAPRPKPRPRDKDWYILIGSIAAAMDGANESVAKAVIMSVSSDLYTNR